MPYENRVMAQLEAQNITKAYAIDGRSLIILHDVTCSIEKGELLAITGASGSGKSTLMKILGCLDVPTTGTLLVNGQEVSLMSANQLAYIRNHQMGFIFQMFYLIPDLTALDNVALPQLYAGKSEKEAHKRATEVLDWVGLGDRLQHLPLELSGGEQQRVAIARALVNKPAIILADEPTGNLDSKTGNLIMNIFTDLNIMEQITVIIVTHDIALANKTKRIIKLFDGKIIEDKQNIPA